MAEATPLGRTLDGDVGAHWPDEVDPDGERLSSVPENGVVEGGRTSSHSSGGAFLRRLL